MGDGCSSYLAQPAIRIVTPGSRHTEIAAELAATPGLRSDDVPDIELAALAIEHGLVLASHDHGFRRFEGLRTIDRIEPSMIRSEPPGGRAKSRKTASYRAEAPAPTKRRLASASLPRTPLAVRLCPCSPARSSSRTDAAGLRLVRFLWCGNDGTIRAKASGRTGSRAGSRRGIGVTVAMQAMNGARPAAAGRGHGAGRRVPARARPRHVPRAARTRRAPARC